MNIEIQGGEQVAAALEKLGAEAPGALGVGLTQWAEAVMADSKSNYVPVDTGVLRASGTVTRPEVQGPQVTLTLGYGGAAAPYALSVHENPRAGKTGGVSPSGKKYRHWARVGEGKFLETPIKRHAVKLRVYLARALTQAMGKTAQRARQARGGFRFR